MLSKDFSKEVSRVIFRELYNRDIDYNLSGWNDMWELHLKCRDGWELLYSELDDRPYEVSYIKEKYKKDGTLNRIKIKTFKTLNTAIKHLIKVSS